jgi:hypothetical protein
MVIDHIGIILFPDTGILRVIGRVSFPLFAFLIAYGCTKTRNLPLYFIRLTAFAFLCHVILPGWNSEKLNIFYTLAFGVFIIMLIEITVKYYKNINLYLSPSGSRFLQYRYKKFVAAASSAAVILALLALLYFSKINYGIGGVLLILLFWVTLKVDLSFTKKTALPCLLIFNIVCILKGASKSQIFSFFAVFFIICFSDTKIKSASLEKYAFYLFYPIHIAVLFGFKLSFLYF